MSSVIQQLEKKNLIHPPKFLVCNTQYETMMGGHAYGVSDDNSDVDIYGFCIPLKDMIFPHLSGEIMGFGTQKKRFDQYQETHVKDISARHGNGQEYDISIYNIVKYFHLCMENNPNMIDSLFVPSHCILSITQIGNLVRENRKLFLHKGSWHKFKGYAFSQMHKMDNKNPEGKRKELVEKFGYDVKFAYHVVRLMLEVEQILVEHDIDLVRNKEQLKSIKRGEWKHQDIVDYFQDKEKKLESVYIESKLQHRPDEEKIKQLLLNCLEIHYGNLSNAITIPGAPELYLKQIKDIIERSGV